MNDEGKLHGWGYPAVEWHNGTKEWWREGVRSRNKGPAIYFEDGSMEYWDKGVRHNLLHPSAIKRKGFNSTLTGETVEVTVGKVVTSIEYPEHILANRDREVVFYHHGKELKKWDWEITSERRRLVRIIDGVSRRRGNNYSKYNRN